MKGCNCLLAVLTGAAIARTIELEAAGRNEAWLRRVVKSASSGRAGGCRIDSFAFANLSPDSFMLALST